MKKLNVKSLKNLSVFCSLAVFFAAASSAPAQVQLINLNLSITNDPAFEGESFYSNMSGAAVLGGAGDTWNNKYNSQPTGSVSNLVDSTGVATGVTFSETNLVGVDNNGSYQNFKYDLFNTFQHLTGNAGSVTFSGLSANATYDFVVYGFNGDTSGNPQSFRDIVETTNGITRTLDDVSEDGFVSTLVGDNEYSGNYLEFYVKTDNSGSFTMSLNPEGGLNLQNAISGFQLQSTPEPSTWALLAGGMVALVCFARRRSAV